MNEITSAKWSSIQEIRSLALKCNIVEIFTINDGIDCVLKSVKSMNLQCGLRTDHPVKGYFYPFYLPDRNELLSGNITLNDFRNAIEKIWDKDSQFYIIVSSSPNLIEDQLWDAVVWVTEYRIMFGEIHVGACNSLRYAWKNLQLLPLYYDDIWKYNHLPKVRGDLIKRKLYNRRVEVSVFPTLGLYYWEIGKENKIVSINPAICWAKRQHEIKSHVRHIDGKAICGSHQGVADLFYDEKDDLFFLDNAKFNIVDKRYVCDQCAKISRSKK